MKESERRKEGKKKTEDVRLCQENKEENKKMFDQNRVHRKLNNVESGCKTN